MKVIGIIAEYNPFHNGHAWQIRKIREITKADYIVIAMSGDLRTARCPRDHRQICPRQNGLSLRC